MSLEPVVYCLCGHDNYEHADHEDVEGQICMECTCICFEEEDD